MPSVDSWIMPSPTIASATHRSSSRRQCSTRRWRAETMTMSCADGIS